MTLSSLDKKEVLELLDDSITTVNNIFNKISDKKQIYELSSIATKGSDKALIIELENELKYITKFHKELQNLEGFSKSNEFVKLNDGSFESLKWGEGLQIKDFVNFNRELFELTSKFKQICIVYFANKD